MRRYSREAEEAVQAQDLIWEWMRSGLLEKEQIPRLSEDLQTDLRRTNNFLRLVLFLFTAIIIGASVLLLIDILHITEDRARAMACVGAAALCFGLAECLVAKFRAYRFGVEEALGVGAVVLVIAAVAQMMSNANIDSVLMSNANIDSVLAMALALGAIGGLLLYLRFGFVYAGVIAIACAAMIPFPLVHPVVVRHLLAAAILLVSFVVVRGNDLFQATAWVGLYVVLNLQISPDAVNDRGWFYWTTYVMIWLLPILGLGLSLRRRPLWRGRRQRRILTAMITLLFGIIALALVLRSFSYGSNRGRYRFPVQIRFSDLWRFEGKVDRGTYAFVGLAGFAIKHNIDR